MVAFKFSDDADPVQVGSIVSALRDLKNQISEIVSIQSGRNNSPESLNNDFTHAFIIKFANEQDRDTYLVHPAHEEFKSLIKPFVADVFVFDFFDEP
ncbi:MAG: Dabb family protein [Leptolyngbya sp.]|nr:Dabb family protein [Candidatus Melainabacteria bacterium]